MWRVPGSVQTDGLGAIWLNIVKKMFEENGRRVWVKSPPPDWAVEGAVGQSAECGRQTDEMMGEA